MTQVRRSHRRSDPGGPQNRGPPPLGAVALHGAALMVLAAAMSLLPLTVEPAASGLHERCRGYEEPALPFGYRADGDVEAGRELALGDAEARRRSLTKRPRSRLECSGGHESTSAGSGRRSKVYLRGFRPTVRPVPNHAVPGAAIVRAAFQFVPWPTRAPRAARRVPGGPRHLLTMAGWSHFAGGDLKYSPSIWQACAERSSAAHAAFDPDHRDLDDVRRRTLDWAR